jgi:hypothetical protein
MRGGEIIQTDGFIPGPFGSCFTGRGSEYEGSKTDATREEPEDWAILSMGFVHSHVFEVAIEPKERW